MIKFNFFKRNTYRAAHRPNNYVALMRRRALKRKMRITASAVLFVIAASALVFIFPKGQAPQPNNDQKGFTAPLVTSSNTDNPLAEKKFYVDPQSNAARQAAAWRTSRPGDAVQMAKLADQPSARWFSNAITFDEVHNYVAAARDQNAIPITVAYFIPKRDCDKYSSGGAVNEASYYDYIDTYAKAIGSMDAVVILEPDALVHTFSNNHQGQPCLNDTERNMYFTLLTYAVDRFKSLPATLVYIDAGNSDWAVDANTMASLLETAGVDKADGFSLNVSNFQVNASTVAFGNAISARAGNKHYVIDTSRNGAGPYENVSNRDYNWCNPPGRALGHFVTNHTGMALVDAFLYIKNIGESDGTDPDYNKCFGGPAAGTWWPDYALGLVQRWPADLQYAYKP